MYYLDSIAESFSSDIPDRGALFNEKFTVQKYENYFGYIRTGTSI